MSANEILKIIRLNKEKLSQLGVRQIGLFGSQSRGDATPGSDLDFLVEFVKGRKSYDNYIAFNDSSKDIFGKIMSLSDDAMWEYFKLLLNFNDNQLDDLKNLHPMDAKKTLAESLTSLFFDEFVGEKERAEFSKVFSKVYGCELCMPVKQYQLIRKYWFCVP